MKLKPKPPALVQTDCPWCGSIGLVCENQACPKKKKKPVLDCSGVLAAANETTGCDEHCIQDGTKSVAPRHKWWKKEYNENTRLPAVRHRCGLRPG